MTIIYSTGENNMTISIRLKIKTIYSDLSPKEKVIADYVLENPDIVSHSSISDLSNHLDIADSTFFQFTKKLGFNGFKDFKLEILKQSDDTSTLIHEKIHSKDSKLIMAQKVFDSSLASLNGTQKLLKEEDLVHATEIVNHSKRLIFFGVGGSEIVAADAYHKFLRSPIAVTHSSDYHVQLMEASLLTSDDCALIISHTGKSKETIELATVAKKTGAKIIVLTSQINSPLAKLGDVVFISISEETEFRSEALSSRIAQLAILDSLFVILMFDHRTKATESISKVRRTISKTKD